MPVEVACGSAAVIQDWISSAVFRVSLTAMLTLRVLTTYCGPKDVEPVVCPPPPGAFAGFDVAPEFALLTPLFGAAMLGEAVGAAPPQPARNTARTTMPTRQRVCHFL